MTLNLLIDELKELPEAQLEEVYQFVHTILKGPNDYKNIHFSNTQSTLELAVNELIVDYNQDKELTAFTQLDTEDFYEAR